MKRDFTQNYFNKGTRPCIKVKERKGIQPQECQPHNQDHDATGHKLKFTINFEFGMDMNNFELNKQAHTVWQMMIHSAANSKDHYFHLLQDICWLASRERAKGGNRAAERYGGRRGRRRWTGDFEICEMNFSQSALKLHLESLTHRNVAEEVHANMNANRQTKREIYTHKKQAFSLHMQEGELQCH